MAITMRKVILSIVCICLCSMARSQVLISILFGDKLNTDAIIFGIHIDYSFNQITNIDPQKNLGKLNLALFFDVRINERWRAEIEALAKHTRGGKGIEPYPLNDPQLDLQFAEGSVERKINYVGLMTAIQYTIQNVWYFETGPQLTLRTKAHDIFQSKTADGELELKRDIEDQIARWEFSIIAGAGYKFGKGTGMALGVRYNWGISDVQTNTSGTQQNRGFYIVSNIPIGRKKKAAMAAQ